MRVRAQGDLRWTRSYWTVLNAHYTRMLTQQVLSPFGAHKDIRVSKDFKGHVYGEPFVAHAIKNVQ